MMSKVAVTLPQELLRRAKKAVGSGRAKNVSALVTEALADKLEDDELGRVLAELDVKYGPPGKDAERWADRVMKRLATDR